MNSNSKTLSWLREYGTLIGSEWQLRRVFQTGTYSGGSESVARNVQMYGMVYHAKSWYGDSSRITRSKGMPRKHWRDADEVIECPACGIDIPDQATVCPHCHIGLSER